MSAGHVLEQHFYDTGHGHLSPFRVFAAFTPTHSSGFLNLTVFKIQVIITISDRRIRSISLTWKHHLTHLVDFKCIPCNLNIPKDKICQVLTTEYQVHLPIKNYLRNWMQMCILKSISILGSSLFCGKS